MKSVQNWTMMGVISFMLLCGVISLAQESGPADGGAGGAGASTPKVGTWIMGVPDTEPAQLPPGCLTGDPCQAKIIRVIRQTSNPMRWDAWIRATNGDHHTHLVRLHIGSYWVWLGHGSLVWPKALKLYSVANPSKNIIGPLPLRSLGDNATFCNAVAEDVLVNVTTDAGTLIPDRCAGGNDAGLPCSYPDGGTVNCASAWWLLRSKFGGPWSPLWSVSDLTSTPGAPGRTVRPRVPATVWDAPPARTHRMCSVPVATPCP